MKLTNNRYTVVLFSVILVLTIAVVVYALVTPVPPVRAACGTVATGENGDCYKDCHGVTPWYPCTREKWQCGNKDHWVRYVGPYSTVRVSTTGGSYYLCSLSSCPGYCN